MVAAFRDNARDTQLPFSHGATSRSQPSPSFDYTYADPAPVDNPFFADVHPVEVNPRTRPTLAKGIITSAPHGFHGTSRATGVRATSVGPYGAPPHSQASRQPHLFSPETSTLVHPWIRPQVGAIQPMSNAVPVRSPGPHSIVSSTVRRTASVTAGSRQGSPKGLRWLMLGQKGLCLVTLSLVGIALSLYGQSVYQHRQWGMTYSQLEQLQKLEQQGMAASEIMKHSLAEEAEHPDSGMSSLMPSAAIPIEAVPARAWDEAPDVSEALLDIDLDGPMGY